MKVNMSNGEKKKKNFFQKMTRLYQLFNKLF